ncbi:MAG: hypothetical protein QXW80_02330 [Candidatus Micrarchaeia archaeon]
MAIKRLGKVNEDHKDKEQGKEKRNFSERRRKDLLFLGFALLVIFIVLFWILQTPPQQVNTETKNKVRGNIEQFKESLLNAEGIIIIDKVTGLSSDKAKYIYACGAGLAGSWGKIGKNISNLYTFVIDGEECTYSSPRLINNELSHESTATNTNECIKKIREMQKNPLYVTFEINYGPLYSIYETHAAYLFVNEDFVEECSFRTSETVPTITEQ